MKELKKMEGTAADHLGFLAKSKKGKKRVFHGNKAMTQHRRPLEAVQRMKVWVMHNEPHTWKKIEQLIKAQPASKKV